ncbi:glycosyltransferase [Duncaniella muricolitica]|jgi:glycosyltransferase involved in cell wall biosynthesis|uniref:glycosyltransferase n=1 Tax=Duncaniella muricolitica TaxID=2880704 RepID=UPI00244DEBDB|nr:glycosyltransferase [Duncaniella muricolitica]
MNICFFITQYPNPQAGGIENVTYRLALGLLSRGNNVSCITFGKSTELDLPFECLRITENTNENIILNFISQRNIDIIINQCIEIKWFYILKYIRLKLPNIKLIKAHHTDPLSSLKGVCDNEPLYINANDFSRLLYHISPITFFRKKRRYNYLKTQYHEWGHFYDSIVLLSQRFIPVFKQLSGYNSCFVTAIENPVEFNNDNISINKEKIIVYVGRLNREAKRPDRLLKIWGKIYKSFPDWKLIFIGDGPLRNSLEIYTKQHQLEHVYFTGQINPSNYLRKASIICITSTYEGFSLVCAEALANNVIPIAFDSYEAIKDLIDDGRTGILVKPYNLNIYANNLTELMYNTTFSNQLYNNISSDKNIRQRLSMDNILNNWEILFHKLLS